MPVSNGERATDLSEDYCYCSCERWARRVAGALRLLAAAAAAAATGRSSAEKSRSHHAATATLDALLVRFPACFLVR